MKFSAALEYDISWTQRPENVLRQRNFAQELNKVAHEFLLSKHLLTKSKVEVWIERCHLQWNYSIVSSQSSMKI